MKLTNYLLAVLLLFTSAVTSFSQISATKRATAKVVGRIIVNGQPASGVQVLLKKKKSLAPGSGSAQSPAVTAITNTEGQYQLANLTAGDYRVSVYAPAYVIEGESALSYEYGKTITVSEGEQVENLNFSLILGGVITGKVTDDSGMPVIGEGVGAFRLDEQGKRDKIAAGGMLRWQTDDRGVYRIFGLEPGRYVVGVGASNEDAVQPIGNRGSYKRVYHPDVVDESNAGVVEVKSGGEVENVDIKLSRTPKSFTASGRVIDAETGKPLPGVTIGCEFAKAAGSSFRMGDIATDTKGEFRIEGLLPNTYTTYVYNPGQSDIYSERVNFDVADENVTGIEIKMLRGATISGVIAIEGTRDPSVLGRVSQISIRAEGVSQDTAAQMMSLMQGGGIGTINPDATFKIGGVRPGKTRIVALPAPEVKGLSFARVERNGAEIKELDATQGEQITGVRVIFTYGTSVLAGQVEIKGGTLPADARMILSITRDGASLDEWWFAKSTRVDARGQFSLEGVSEGNYKAYLIIVTSDANFARNFPRIEQSVSIPADVRREITFVLDLSRQNNQ